MTFHRFRWALYLSLILGVVVAIYWGGVWLFSTMPEPPTSYSQHGFTRWSDVWIIPVAAFPIFWLIVGNEPARGPDNVADMMVGCGTMLFLMPFAMMIGTFGALALIHAQDAIAEWWYQKGVLSIAHWPWVVASPFFLLSFWIRYKVMKERQEFARKLMKEESWRS